jgi:hypothetical protein
VPPSGGYLKVHAEEGAQPVTARTEQAPHARRLLIAAAKEKAGAARGFRCRIDIARAGGPSSCKAHCIRPLI